MTDRIADYALGLPGAWPDEPWDGDRVAKVGRDGAGKIFVFLGHDTIGLKCGTREEADEWLERYPGDASVMAYIGRSGWNTLRRAGAISEEELCEAVADSYAMVVGKLPRKHRPEGWDQ
ncbi:MAG TPA: MmcQ/YjbR family DNA-binding protein [Ornithinicoccus sp.]|nr:MmcQ/YjbR family DNA-binding protein [Ornithinicoccus sp.]